MMLTENPPPIAHWIHTHTGIGAREFHVLQLDAAFDVFVCRCEDARRRGSADPLKTVSPKGSGGNSRLTTRRMLRRIGYTDAQLRIIHRLIAGSSSGWPGLLRLFVEAHPLTTEQRGYVRRQVRAFLSDDGTGSQDAARSTAVRSRS